DGILLAGPVLVTERQVERVVGVHDQGGEYDVRDARPVDGGNRVRADGVADVVAHYPLAGGGRRAIPAAVGARSAAHAHRAASAAAEVAIRNQRADEPRRHVPPGLPLAYLRKAVLKAPQLTVALLVAR